MKLNASQKFFLLGLSVFFIGVTATAFADSSDSDWSNKYKITSPYDHTPAREKENRTAYYNYTKNTNVVYITIWAALYDGRDVSNGHSYLSYAGDKTFLYNEAVEEHGTGVAVRIDSKSWNNGYANGVWSPDSVR
ncbi:hypothetical protein IGI37_003574 [Enterococcus sp. AZ194]|uniref:hypothetical protein n=1 Tax=Enterococcus sp. AZ194 TaxID=2774629 RepID=UPI003F2708C5